MNYIKINQQIVKTWLNEEKQYTRIGRGRIAEAGGDGESIAVTAMNGAVIYIIPEIRCPLDYNKLTRVFREFDLETFIGAELRRSHTRGMFTGVQRKAGNKTILEIESKTTTAWLDKKVTELFDKNAEYRVGETPLRGLTVYECGDLVGLVAPVDIKRLLKE